MTAATSNADLADATLVTTLGRDPHANHGLVNPPIWRGSTILSPTLAAMEARAPGAGSYGRYGTPTAFALEAALAKLDHAAAAFVVGSGGTAISATLLSLLSAGDHMVVTDAAYAPTRRLADGLLHRLGITTTFVDPRIGGGIAAALRPTTKVVFVESPGSLTFEIQDLPAIALAARAVGALVICDNTWATPLYHRPLDLGADIVIQSGTKYIGGHSDLMLGVITCRAGLEGQLAKGIHQTATASAPEDAWLALRGLRTLAVRLPRHQESALELASWLQLRPEVVDVLHPALPSSPDHGLWRRDFTGATGLFGFILQPARRAALAALLDGLELYGMGFSWGGYESLLIPTDPGSLRTARPWTVPGQAMRVHVGLEDPHDLIRDLEAGFERFREAA